MSRLQWGKEDHPRVFDTVEFHVPPINVPTLSPRMAFAMLPGWFRLKTTTASRKQAHCNYMAMSPTHKSQ